MTKKLLALTVLFSAIAFGQTAISVKSLNKILFADQYGSIDNAVTACGSNPCTVIIPSNYSGAESINLITTSMGYKVYIGANKVTIIDHRANAATPGAPGNAPLYPITYGGRMAGQLERFGATYATTGTVPDSTAGATFFNWIYNATFPSSGDLFGIVGVVNTSDSMTIGTSTSRLAGGDFEANVNSTSSDKALPEANGLTAGVHINRSNATVGIVDATAVRGKSAANSSTSGATITNAYSFLAEDPVNTATTRNYGFFNQGKYLWSNNKTFDILDSGGTVRNVFGSTVGDDVFWKPLSDSVGFNFYNQAGALWIGMTDSLITINRPMTITAAGTPTTDNTYAWGASGKRWSGVYGVLGDFSGLVTASGGISTGTAGSTNHAVCWKDTTHIGYCSTVVAADGTCTCN